MIGKKIKDDAHASAVKHYRSQTLNAETKHMLQKQVMMKAQRERTHIERNLAFDARTQEQLKANEGLVQTYPAITFTPEHEVLRRKKEQQKKLREGLAEAILLQHRT